MSLSREHILATATAAQKPAVRPDLSVVVDASAGSGKTYVLTQRILALLMDGDVSYPEQILAVTYTRAAAAEMAERVRRALAEWATMSEDKLHQALTKLLDREICDDDVRKARNLFAVVLDAPQGLNIATIHAFCQSLLARFPLEAGLTPGFTLLEGGDQQEMLSSALSGVLVEASKGIEGLPSWVFAHMANQQAESTLYDTYDKFVQNRRRFLNLRRQYGGLPQLLAHTAATLGLEELPQNPDDLARYAPWRQLVPAPILATVHRLIALAPQGGKTTQEWAAGAALWAENPHAATAQTWAALTKLVTKQRTLNSNLITKGVREADPGIEDAVQDVFMWVLAVEESYYTAETWLMTAAWLSLGYCIIDRYEQLKKAQGVLDFDDLIDATRRLLAGDEGQGAWVRYKLDSRLKHVLVDEAQDTDYDQWQILAALREEFFSGEGQHEGRRTMFAVGDPKQAIYRFRGAVPDLFAELYPELAAQAEAVGQSVEKVELQTSFRSSPPILQAVDQVFATPERRRLVDGQSQPLKHHSVHVNAAGRVEIWPAEPKGEEAAIESWPLPLRREKPTTPRRQLYAHLAAWIRQQIDNPPLLTTTPMPRPLRAGDILLLVRGKTHVGELMAALSRAGIASSQAEEVTLLEAPVVADMMALLRFLANAEDDLALLHTLRSPLFGLTDDDILQLLEDRQQNKGSLWKSVYGSQRFEAAKQALSTLMQKADYITPHALVLLALELTQGRGKLCQRLSGGRGGAAADAVAETLDAFLDVVHGYDQHHLPGLSGFIHWFETGAPTVKREAATDPNAVRIMTAHGSKGLQAPVVILPEATGGYFDQHSKEKITWLLHADGTDALCLYRLGKDRDVETVKKAQAAEQKRVEADEMRLLYVAMTRAQEVLVVAGLEESEKTHSWYKDLLDTAEHGEGWEKQADGTWLLAMGTTQQGRAVEKATDPTAEPLPAWATTALAGESVPARLTAAAEALEERNRAEALLDTETAQKFRRGLLVHRLLEWLPRLPSAVRTARGAAYLQRQAPDFSEAKRAALLEEALEAIRACPELFADGMRGEVALVAQLEKGLLEGARVDALRVTDTQVLIVDYKTNTHIPDEMPAAYRRQLALYAAAASQIWPQKQVRTAVLWTAASPPRLQWLEAAE